VEKMEAGHQEEKDELQRLLKKKSDLEK